MRGMNGIQLAVFTAGWVLLLTVIGRVLKAQTEDGENVLLVAFARPILRRSHSSDVHS